MARTITVPITTAADGSATATRIGLHGEVLAVGVNTGDLATNVDIAVTDDLTGVAIATFTDLTTATKYQRKPKDIPVTAAGAALATAGPVASPVLTGRLKIVVAQGGNVKSGTVYVVVA